MARYLVAQGTQVHAGDRVHPAGAVVDADPEDREVRRWVTLGFVIPVVELPSGVLVQDPDGTYSTRVAAGEG